MKDHDRYFFPCKTNNTRIPFHEENIMLGNIYVIISIRSFTKKSLSFGILLCVALDVTAKKNKEIKFEIALYVKIILFRNIV